MTNFEELVEKAENILISPSSEDRIQEFYHVLDNMASTEVIRYYEKAREEVVQLIDSYMQSR